MGIRLSSKDKILLNNSLEQKYDIDIHDEQLCNIPIIPQNKSVVRIYQALAQKRKMLVNKDILNNRYQKKYNQLSSLSLTDDNVNNAIVYNFGVTFDYCNEQTNDCSTDVIPTKISYIHSYHVHKKYSSLKEELTQNEISILLIEQFDAEYTKGLLHFSSYYCKANYLPLRDESEQMSVRYGDDDKYISIGEILSLIIYCNYTELQHKFSKTYRENIESHNNFYHFGKYLKIAVQIFGVCLKESKVNTFYHGIGEQVTFPAYNHNIVVNCPLSTSLSWEVALNFTNNQTGLVIEFASPCGGSQATYFSVSWLSDFSNEHECLFLQNFDMEWKHWKVNPDLKQLRIVNITDVKLGYEYKHILNALTVIKIATTTDSGGFDFIFEQDAKHFALTPYEITISAMLRTLIIAIVECRLDQLNISKCKTKIKLNTYANHIVDTFWKHHFTSVITYVIDYTISELKFLYDILHPKRNRIQFSLTSVVSPSAQKLLLYGIHISSLLLNDILSCIRKHQHGKLKMIRLANAILFSSKWEQQDKTQYKQQFEQIGWNLRIQCRGFNRKLKGYKYECQIYTFDEDSDSDFWVDEDLLYESFASTDMDENESNDTDGENESSDTYSDSEFWVDEDLLYESFASTDMDENESNDTDGENESSDTYTDETESSSNCDGDENAS
eukprot:303698_1